MNEHAQSIARRRAALQLQCALQREEFALHASQLKEDLHSAGRGIEMVRGLRIVPMIMAATSAAGLVSRASGLIRLLGRAWFIFSTLRRLRGATSRRPPEESRSPARREARSPRRR
jgi:YqjK-like protein